MARRRRLTEEEHADAERLRALWSGRDPALGLTNQEAMADKCGWTTQGAFSQYLNGTIPLGLKAAKAIADALGVELRDISPRLADTAQQFAGQPSAQSAVNRLDTLTQSEIDLILGYRRVPGCLQDAVRDIIDGHLKRKSLRKP